MAELLIAQPSIASVQSKEKLSITAEELRALLPHSNVDVLVERYPVLLDIDQVKEAIKDLAVLMPGKNFEDILQQNPNFLFSLQKGSNMIPYDEVPTSSI